MFPITTGDDKPTGGTPTPTPTPNPASAASTPAEAPKPKTEGTSTGTGTAVPASDQPKPGTSDVVEPPKPATPDPAPAAAPPEPKKPGRKSKETKAQEELARLGEFIQGNHPNAITDPKTQTPVDVAIALLAPAKRAQGSGVDDMLEFGLWLDGRKKAFTVGGQGNGPNLLRHLQQFCQESGRPIPTEWPKA